MAAKPKSWRRWSVHWMRAEWPHRITRLHQVPTWSLLFVGRRRREWGFITTKGWVHYRDYEHVLQTATTHLDSPPEQVII